MTRNTGTSGGEVPGFEDFFEASLVRVRDLCRTFDSFGHLDYAVRYAPHQNDFYDYRHLSQWIDPLLKILIENGKSLLRRPAMPVPEWRRKHRLPPKG